MPTPASTIHEFNNEHDARDYRHENGTGGWIFVSDETARAYLFPPFIVPWGIFHHELTAGKSGKLIGSQ